MIVRRSHLDVRHLCLLGGLALLSCKEEPAPVEPDTEAEKADEAKNNPALDPNVAKAVQEVAGPMGSAGAGGGDGPPESGIFPPGRADKELAKGAPPKITVGSTGSGDKIPLAPPLLLEPGRKRDVTATVGIRTGPRSAMPSIDVSLNVAAEKKGGEEAEGASPVEVVAKVTAAKLAADQPGQLPPGLDAQVKKLVGSKLRYVQPPTGGLSNLVVEPSAGADPSFVRELASAAEFLPAAYGPFPTEPVGAGAFWMVTSREPFVGLDTVTYRMMRVEKLEPGRATISVGTRRYVAGGSLDLEGLPPHAMQGFQGEGTGTLTLSTTDAAFEASSSEQAVVLLTAPNDPQQRMNLPLEFSVLLSAGPKKPQ